MSEAASSDAQPNAAPAAASAARIWLLQGPKHGDNAQLEAVAEALGARMPCHVQRVALSFHAAELLVNVLLGVSLAGLRASSRRALPGPPWPDLLLTAGRRNEPVARWLQREAGGRCAIVHCGRPWADPRRFDLILSTPQYELDPAHYTNVVQLALPPTTLRPLRAAASSSAPMLLVFGGDSGSKQLPPAAALDILERSQLLAAALTRPLRVITSPRTPQSSEAALAARCQTLDVEFHGWHGAARDNPYEYWLDDAGAFVVTEDSVSMVADAAARRRPLWIAPLARSARPWWMTLRGWRWKSATHELAQRLAPRRFRRDTRRLLEALVTDGRARWLDAMPEGAVRAPEAEPMPPTEPTSATHAAEMIADRILRAPSRRR